MDPSTATHPLTVAHLLPGLDGGGVETDVVGLSAALVAAGDRSLVISAGGRMVERVTAGGGHHIQMPIGAKSPAALLCIPRLKHIISEYKVDIVHAHSRMPAWIGWLATRRLKGTHFVTSIHGLNTPGWYSAVMLKGERVIAVSETVRAFVAANYPKMAMERVEVIPRGVDPAAFPFGHQPSTAWRQAWMAQYPRLVGRFVIAIVGRLTRLKGHHEAFAAFRLLLDAGVNAHLLVVGGEDPKRLGYAAEIRAAAAGFGDRITFTGQRSDVRDLVSVCDVVLSASTKPESFGLSVLEALRLGVPVVGFDHGGVGEVLATVYPAGRVQVRDAAAMAQRLKALAGGQLARPQVSAAFPLEQTQARTLALYRALALAPRTIADGG